MREQTMDVTWVKDDNTYFGAHKVDNAILEPSALVVRCALVNKLFLHKCVFEWVSVQSAGCTVAGRETWRETRDGMAKCFGHTILEPRVSVATNQCSVAVWTQCSRLVPAM